MAKRKRGYEQHTAAHFRDPDSYREMARRRRRPRRRALVVIAVVAGLVAVAVAGVAVAANLPVSVTVNGAEVRVRRGSTVDEVFGQASPQVSAGDLLAVDGSVITAGSEDAYEATLERDGADAQSLDPGQAAGVSVEAGDRLTFSDGDDVTEDYTATQTTEQPELTTTGTQGIVFYVSQWGYPGITEQRTGSVSGKTVEVQVQERQDAVVVRATPTPANGEKLVALTFDDGPSSYTDSYLDILDQYGAKATFFLIGEQVSQYPDSVRRAVSEGNQVATHTWDHKQLTTLTQPEVQQELSDSLSAITDATGLAVSTLRPPYGSIDPTVWLYSGGRITIATYWSHDTRDWAQPGVSQIVANATTYYAPGSIILMHDGGGAREQDLEALPQVIKAWQDQGYRFVTLSELLASDPDVPQDIATGTAQMPEGAVWPTSLSADSVDNGTK
jgi:peptidoglycan/xylan/chitin deacetylase (PgdA/CDA1 family)